MGPLPLNIGKINRLAPAHVLAVCVVQCTSCTECELVQVVCTTDAAPIYIALADGGGGGGWGGCNPPFPPIT